MFTQKHSYFRILLLFLLAGTVLYSCGKSKKGGSQKEQGGTKLQAAGATFPYPLYSKMFNKYNDKHDVQVNYQAIGSGGGIRQLNNKTVNFGASDAPMTDEEMKQAPAPIVHIPTCLGAVVITYNLPGSPKLKMTPDIITDMFLGKIKKWNDKRIKAVNPDVDLPDLNVTVVHRSDGSGTTFIFSDYLAKVSDAWQSKVGRGKSLSWPIGLGGKGNPGVAGLVKQTPGSIGYVELIYALQNDMPFANLKNKSGHFITPSLESVSKAANVDIPADARVSITDTDAEQGYPISSFTYLLLYKDLKTSVGSKAKAQEVVKLVDWMLHDGQQYAKPLDYAPLPDAALKVAMNNLKSVTYDGQQLLGK